MRRSPLGLVLLLACGGDKAGGDDTSGEGSAMSVLTWNVGLAYGFVPYSPERQPAVVEAVAALDADVVCLNEVWTEADITAITEAAAATFPHHAVEMTLEEGASGEPACTPEEAEPLKVCAESNCADTDDLTGCVLTFCAAEFDALSDTCTACAAANIGLNDVDAILEVCTSGSGTFSWGGHNGLLMLSRLPMAEVTYTTMDSWLVQRGLLAATVDGVEVGCTHLAAELTVPAYGGATYASYSEENAAQMAQVLATLEGRPGDKRVLLGDLNTGPAAGSLSAELPESWALASGWADPNVDSAAPFCTWCVENPLTGALADLAIDHVLVQGMAAGSPSRIGDAPITVTGADGEATVALSDHYGLQAVVE